MELINDLNNYKELIRWNKERLRSVEKNCYLMSNIIEDFIREQRLYMEAYEDGVVLYLDEGRYYNMYYFWKASTPFANFRKSKPILVEELNNNGHRDKYLAKFEPMLLESGFEILKNNLQLELKLSNKEDYIKKYLEEKACQLKKNNLQLDFCKYEEEFEQVVDLWKSALDVTDIPQDHLCLGREDKIACVFTENNEVVATNWWKNSNKNSEGRHTVTHPDFYKRGLASTLLLSWCEDAKNAGCERCFTWVCDKNYRSLELFKKLGFSFNGRTSKQYILK